MPNNFGEELRALDPDEFDTHIDMGFDTQELISSFGIQSNTINCAHCNRIINIKNSRVRKVLLLDLPNFINLQGTSYNCEHCFDTTITFDKDGLKHTGKATEFSCRVFENVQYCTMPANEQADYLLGLKCEITGKSLVYLTHKGDYYRYSKELQNRVGFLLGYSDNTNKLKGLHVVSLEGKNKIRHCQYCNMNEFTKPKNMFFDFYNENNDKIVVCNDCKAHIRDKFFGYKFRFLKGGKKNMNPFDRLVGIELETVGGSDFKYFDLVPQLQGKVSCKYDGSLYASNYNGEEDDVNSPVNRSDYEQDNDRDSRGAGREFVIVPHGRDELFRTINVLCAFLKNKSISVNKSCGFHCHFDMKKENYTTVRKTFLAFSLFEDVLFSFLPPSRRKSKYCLPLKKNYKQFFSVKGKNEQAQFEHYWYNSLNDSYIDGQKTDKYNSTRYVSINYHALFFHGTLENRQHCGTLNATKIINWILLNQIIIDFAKNSSMKRLLKIRGDINTLIHIIRQYEKTYPVLVQHNLVEYFQARNRLFAQPSGAPLKVLEELESNLVEQRLSQEYLNMNLLTKV